jgi:hypothetical protein
MSETTKEERDDARRILNELARTPGVKVEKWAVTCMGALNDADRLAELEANFKRLRLYALYLESGINRVTSEDVQLDQIQNFLRFVMREGDADATETETQ